MLTRVFKSGNSLAVRIPKELAFLDPADEVDIERVGNTLVLRPIERETLADVPAILASFPKSFMAEGRDFHEQKERDWGSVLGRSAPEKSEATEPPEPPKQD